MKPVCVLLGAGPGIGRSVANQFLSRGYHVALVARSLERLQALSTELSGETSVWQTDVSDAAQLTELISRVSNEVGPIEVLIFNVYMLRPGKPSQLRREALENCFSVNVGAALTASKLVLEQMKQLGKGTIILTGGGYALQPSMDLTALSMCKAAIRSLSFCLFEEAKQFGVHAGTVTICGKVKPNNEFDPDKIAEAFGAFHDQELDAAVAEITFTGATSAD